ncbi:MAG: hypothetical protein MMC33_000162 [Icmadophila ericetorum]|nr:hypothetical protein [Icmadophila ericetorum]
MDAFEELEQMALNASGGSTATSDEAPSPAQAARWQKLFGYSLSDATDSLQEYRSDLTRTRVSDDHWDLVRGDKEAAGYDREAYEYECQLVGRSKLAVPTPDPKLGGDRYANADASYLFKLWGPLCTPEEVQEAAGLPNLPQVIQAAGDDGESLFCRVSGTTKQEIEAWLVREQANYKPTFIRLSEARKDLSSISPYPTLGMNSTLPQYRMHNNNVTYRPAQCEYPVWYFFYGTLADPGFLMELLDLPPSPPPVLNPAYIADGILSTWAGGKYKALVNGPDSCVVSGYAYHVQSREHEDILRFYETAKYEVARCTIHMLIGGKEERSVQGLTFRFVENSSLKLV